MNQPSNTSREHSYRARRVPQLAQDVAVGDLVYTDVASADARQGKRACAPERFDEFRQLLAARNLRTEPKGGGCYEVVAHVVGPAVTSCSCCGYRVAFGRCQRCSTRQGSPIGAES